METMEPQEQARWIWDNLLCMGQRLAFIWSHESGVKKAYGLADALQDNDYFRGLILAHVQGSPASATVRYIKKNTTFSKSVTECKLGLYYGGDADIAAVGNYALDCDVSYYLANLKDGLPPEERVGEKWREHVPASEMDREAERLTEMMRSTAKELPNAQFFQKPNGKWHAHGKLVHPRPAMIVKTWLHATLPECCKHIEVFPKTNRVSVPDDQWFNANYIRLPFSPDMQYVQVDGLKEILPDDCPDTPLPVKLEQVASQTGETVLELPESSRIQAVKNYGEKIGDVGEGSRHNETFKVAACALRDNGLPHGTTMELVSEFNRQHCVPPLPDDVIEKQVIDAAAYGRNGLRALPTSTSLSFQPAPSIQPSRPEYERPSLADVKTAITDTPLMTYGVEIRKFSPDLPAEMILSDAMQLAGLLLAQRDVSIGTSPDDIMPTMMNMYCMKLGVMRCGKGTTSRLMEHFAKMMGVPMLKGESESALAAAAEAGARRGLYYNDEIAKLLDPTNAVAKQIVNALTGGFDRGEISWSTRPKGQLNQLYVGGFHPSVLIDGQPSVLEESFGKSLISAGFLARFLISTVRERKRIRKIGSPNSETIKNAYTVYADAPIGKMVLKPLHDPDCAGNRYLPHMTADEEGAWDPLVGLYVPRIALILEPSALTSGTISKDALERAGTIASYFFPNAMMAMKLVHEDKHELRRVKALSFVKEHPGCCRRDIMRKIGGSVMEFEKDIKPTLIARGEIIVNEDRYYPLAA